MSTLPHPDDMAVDRFATAMKLKLSAARRKGRCGWDDPDQCPIEGLVNGLREHLGKANLGNWADIANFCMMLHERGAEPVDLSQQPENETTAGNAAALFEFANSVVNGAYVSAGFDERHVPGIRAAAQYLECHSPQPTPQVPESIVEIGRRMLADTKDNTHYTADPLFLVEKRLDIFGIDTDYAPRIAWIDEDGHEAVGDEAEALEKAYQETGEVPEVYTRTGAEERWEYVDTYLTQQAAEARINGGPDGRVMVESACRNNEMKLVREFLMFLAATSISEKREVSQ